MASTGTLDLAAEQHRECAQVDDDAADQIRDLSGVKFGGQEGAADRDVGDEQRGEHGTDGVGACQQCHRDTVEAHARQAGGVQRVPLGHVGQIEQACAEACQRTGNGHHSTPQAVQALENGLVDFAVVTTPVALKKPLQRIPLYSFREILIGGEEYAETASNKHCLQDLQDIPLIGIAPGSSTRELYTQYFMRHNLPFSPDMEVATTDQIFPMVQHNLGIGFFPEELAAEHIAQGKIVQIPIEEPLPERKICLIRNVKRPQSIAARSLEEHLTSHRETE